MKINGPGPIRARDIRRADKSDKSGGASFASHLTGDEMSTAGTGAARFAPAVDSLLSLQTVGDGREGRRKALARGSTLLDRLDDIRHGLLIGAIPRLRLIELSQALRSERLREPDAKLMQLIQDIELRCAVELAKLGVYVDID
jgi:Class II flagellar assembly regulator